MQTMDKPVGEPSVHPDTSDITADQATTLDSSSTDASTSGVITESPPDTELHPADFSPEHESASAGSPTGVEQNLAARSLGAQLAPEGPKKRGRNRPSSPSDDGPHQTYLLTAVAAVAVAVGVVMWAVAIRSVLFNTNTATGGDMGAHVWTADFVSRKLVGQGRITGWSDDWFAGFPVLGFYFPFPFWIMTILNVVLPYNIAFKLTTVLGLIGMPLTGFGLGHFAGLRKPLPVFCALATVPFLMDQQYAIYGGNIKSTMAGEFSFAVSLALGLLFLGLLSNVMRTGSRRATAAAVLAMTGLSHLLPTIWVGVAGTFIILTHLDAKRTNIRNAYALFLSCAAVTGVAWTLGLERVGIVVAAAIALAAIGFDYKTKRLGLGQFADAFSAVAAGAALAAFWIWPFWNHLPYTNDMGYEKEHRYLWGLFPWVSDKPEASAAVFFFAFCFAIVGALYSIATFVKAVQRSVQAGAFTWHGWGSAFGFSGGLFVTALFWNKVIVRQPVAVASTRKGFSRFQEQVGNELFSYTTLCRLLVFVFAVLVLHVLVFAWTLDDNWQRLGVALTLVTALCALTYRISPDGFRLWNNRVLPFWLMGVYLLAGYGLYAICLGLSRLMKLREGRTAFARNRYSWGVLAGVLVTHAAIAVPLGLVPRFFPTLQFSKEKVLNTKADGTTDEKKSGGWLVGVRTAGASGDYDSSAAKGWPPYNYNGYEDRGANWKDYKQIVDKMNQIGKTNGCGRTHWEYEGKQDRWGTPMALMLLPYWTDSCIQSMEGLYFESAATAPYLWMNSALVSKGPSNPQRDLPYKGLDLTLGIQKLQAFGVRYYMAFSTTAIEQADKNPNLRLIDTAPYQRVCDDNETKAGTCPTIWKIYEVKGAELVQALAYQPAVVTGIGQSQQEGWLDLGTAAYNDPERFPVPLIAQEPIEPPESYQRLKVSESRGPANNQYGATVVAEQAKLIRLNPVTITNIKAASLGTGSDEPGSLSFTVDKVGIPVAIKMSYFPNFKVTGAKGPYRLSDNRMVVIPTKNNVSLEYKWNIHDYLGFAAGILGILMCIAMYLVDRRRRQAAEAERIAQWRSELRNETLSDSDLAFAP
jgi:hypothetical protein